MTNEWLAIRRVGEWVGLEGEQLESYLSEARPVHTQALQSQKRQELEFDDLRSEYFEFLNNFVFSAEPIVECLRKIGVEEDIVRRFEQGTVPIKEAFHRYNVVDYGLDEIVDFVMLLKLFKRYRELTGNESIQPLENLHSLVYLVNYRLSEEDMSHSIEDTMGFGMLSKTGYRYTFEKRQDYTWSESLQRDQDRLFAWKVLNRDVIENPKPEWDVTYSVSLDEAAELFLTRFEARLNEFDSVLLKEWELQQEKVLEDLADSSKTSLSDHLRSLDRFENCGQGRVVLNGRPKRFEAKNDNKKIKTDA